MYLLITGFPSTTRWKNNTIKYKWMKPWPLWDLRDDLVQSLNSLSEETDWERDRPRRYQLVLGTRCAFLSRIFIL